MVCQLRDLTIFFGVQNLYKTPGNDQLFLLITGYFGKKKGITRIVPSLSGKIKKVTIIYVNYGEKLMLPECTFFYQNRLPEWSFFLVKNGHFW